MDIDVKVINWTQEDFCNQNKGILNLSQTTDRLYITYE